MSLCLSFAGCAGCVATENGTAEALLALIEEHGQTVDVFAGVSSGSVIATMLALDHRPSTILDHFVTFTRLFERYHHPLSHWFTHLRTLWAQIMPPDAYRKLSGRLHIGISVVTPTGLRSEVISTFESNEEVMRVVEISCHLFPYRWCPVQLWKGKICCDGAFSVDVIRPEGYRVIPVTNRMIHSTSFYTDWFPTTNLDKMHRLHSAGRFLIQHHRAHFVSLITGEEVVPLVIPMGFRWWRVVKCLVKLWVMYRLWIWARRCRGKFERWVMT